jgi:hypothetical protein
MLNVALVAVSARALQTGRLVASYRLLIGSLSAYPST